MYQSFIQVKNEAESAIAKQNYFENAVCTLKYHLNDRGRVNDRNHYYSYTCGPEDLSKIDGKSYSGVEGSIFACGVYTPNFVKSRTINSGDPRYGVSYTCSFSRDFQEIKLQALKMGQVLEVRAGFNTYESISAPKRDATGYSDPFEIVVTDHALQNILTSALVPIAAIMALNIF